MPGEPYVWIPMPDGACLSARLYLPEGDDRPWPVLLEALPYRKDDLTASYSSEYRRLRDEGRFAVARVDLRGTGASDGVATDEYPAEEQSDLVEVIAWLAAQPWSNGKVGMFGTSYSGFNSLQLAAEQPPALEAVCAIYASDDRYTDDVHYMGGTLRAVDLVDYVIYMTAMCALPPTPALAGDRWRDAWLARVDAAEPWLLRWLEEQWDGDYWRHGSLRRRDGHGGWTGYDRIRCATMIVAGWADGYRNNSFRTYERLQGPRELLVGPWSHMSPATSLPGPHLDLVPEMIRFFDAHLRDRPPATPRAPIRVFLRRPTPPAPDLAEHRGQWRADTTWPPADAAELVLESPRRGTDELAVRGDVGTTAWISCAGHLPWGQPVDQRPDEGLSLVYDWPARDDELVVAGHPRVTVTVAADAPVAFLSAKLCDVFPDGTSQLVTRGFLNLCHRESSLAPEPLVPGEPVTITLELEATAWIFETGHRIRLDLAGTDWPNTWAPPAPLTLTVDAGSLRLTLPTLADATGTEPVPRFTPAPAEEDDHDPSGDRPTVWRIDHDVLARETRAFVDHGTTYDAEHGSRVEEHYAGEVAVSTDDLGIARATATSRFAIEWPDVRVHSEARLEVRSDAEAFDVTVDLDVHEDDELVRTRSWSRRIPRRLQ
jgi:putative CocE/NonD family hydrolase